MKPILLFYMAFAMLVMFFNPVFGQVGIGTDSPDPSSVLDLHSTTDGFLLPRMTTAQRDAINDPAEGLLIFNTETGQLNYYNEGWISIAFWFCGMKIFDTRDSNYYETIRIGTQCWMADNLNVGLRIDGSTEQTDNSIIEKYCYNDSIDNCMIYGGMYQWNEVMQYTNTEGTQGLCPDGWHLPSHAEWTTLSTHLGGNTVAGGKMKSIGTFLWASPNSGATNLSDFNGLPGGRRNTDGSFNYKGSYASFWTSSIYSENTSHYTQLSYNSTSLIMPFRVWNYGHSIRCLKD
jgi:uncharacterized protein (TIGR02145 family)